MSKHILPVCNCWFTI